MSAHAPYTLTAMQSGLLAIRRKGSILMLSPKGKAEIMDDTVENQTKVRQASEHAPLEFYGIFGQIELIAGTYLILIATADQIGDIAQCPVFRARSLLFVPLNQPYAPYRVAAQDQPYAEMIQSLQKHRSFYFSYQLDLTKRMQQTIQEALAPSLSREIEAMFPNSVNYVPQFAFNHKLLHPFRDSQFAPFRTPCIFGFVNIRRTRQVTFALVSRRDSRRPGRRFITRGLDSEGAAANFTETEHLVIVEKGGATQLAAHVQIRGSIPLIWQMKPTMQWSPTVEINPKHALSLEAAQLHVKETNQQYRKQYFINLIDKKGSQHRIGLKMGELLGQLRDENVQYTWFDFHGECKNMKWENLSRLLETV
jgi:hypothetical protein